MNSTAEHYISGQSQQYEQYDYLRADIAQYDLADARFMKTAASNVVDTLAWWQILVRSEGVIL